MLGDCVAPVASHGLEGITLEGLALPLEARRGLVQSLLRSLPRDDLIGIHSDLSRMLQKDIVGVSPGYKHALSPHFGELKLQQLPSEIAVIVLADLSLEDILKCRLVCRSWATLCGEQSLWARLCATSLPPIRPRHTTWDDTAVHYQLLHQPRPANAPDDEAYFEPILDGSSFGDSGGQDIIGSQGGLGGGGGVDLYSMAGGVRGLVWERGGGELPTYTQNHSLSPSTSSRRLPRISFSPRQNLRLASTRPDRAAPSQPILSHHDLPTVFPRVNYQHLYIATHILARRIKGGQLCLTLPPQPGQRPKMIKRPIRPRTLDAISSMEAGGFAGHSESIYSLQLISRQMSFEIVHPSGSYLFQRDKVDRLDDPVSFWRTNPSNPNPPPPNIASGRDWLLSASRDRSLRLWQLSCVRPRVVKIFRHGHSGSILCLAVTDIPTSPPDNSGSSTRSRRPSRRGSEISKRVVAVSGGSDGTLCLWDVENGDGKPEKMVQAHNDSILCVRADDERIVSASKDRTIRVFDVHTLQQLLVIDCNEEQVRVAINAVCLTKDYILSASGDKTLRVWSIHTGEPLARIDAGTRGIASMDFSLPPPHSHPAQRGIIVVGSSDASIRVYHLISHFPGVDIVDALDIMPPLRDLSLRDMLHHTEDEASVGNVEDDGEAGMEPVEDFSEGKAELRLEEAGQCWASCACPARTHDSISALCTRCFNRGHTDLVRSVQLGEQVILSGSYDSTVKVWDRSTGRLLSNLTGGSSGRVFSVVGDRSRIICSGLDAKISLWDYSEGLDTAFVEP